MRVGSRLLSILLRFLLWVEERLDPSLRPAKPGSLVVLTCGADCGNPIHDRVPIDAWWEVVAYDAGDRLYILRYRDERIVMARESVAVLGRGGADS